MSKNTKKVIRLRESEMIDLIERIVNEVKKEMTSKAGQKCTAVRRIIVPEKLAEDVQIALGKRLSETTIGDPSVEGVRMGSLAG